VGECGECEEGCACCEAFCGECLVCCVEGVHGGVFEGCEWVCYGSSVGVYAAREHWGIRSLRIYTIEI
jgi:hypothetical protein